MTSPNKPQTKQALIGLLISAATLFFCVGGIELAGFFWERSTAQNSLGWTLVASRRMPVQAAGSPEQPYVLLQPNRSYVWENIPVNINSRSLRSPEVTLPKPANTFRILNLGDSVAFGWEVDQADTYGQQLAHLLNSQANGLQYEVINAGTPGWTLEYERNFLLQEGFDYQSNLVVLDLTLVNDIYGQPPTVAVQPSLFQWLRDNTYGWPFITNQVRFMRARQVGPEAIPVLNPPREAAAYFPLDESAPVWDKLWTYIDDMHRAAQARQVKLVLVAFPTAFQLNSAGHPNTPQRVFAAKAKAAGIPFVDLLPVYQAACTAAPQNACEGYENLLFADVWMHPNPLGHRLAAEALLPVVRDLP